MSTFGGMMPEINHISIDSFTGENLKSKAFFLSHCHTDHMCGLQDRDFEITLRNNNYYLYVSPVSKSILEKWHPHLKPWIKELDMYSRNFVEIPTLDNPITVSLIPAGHCPGSVMFLFETEKTILYTGDIRIRAKELQKCKLLYDSMGALKSIDNIYLDTTFFKKCYRTFPQRDVSTNAVCTLILDWLEKNDNNHISLNTCAKYGYENLFSQIFQRCGLPIHVDLEKYNLYNCFPEMDKVVTLKANDTRIHNFCIGWNRPCKICIADRKYILQIKPSALRYRQYDIKNDLVTDNWKGEKGVCYSTHCSYGEIIDILKLLKPGKISPCVIPSDVKEEQEMEDLIAEVLKNLLDNDKEDDDDKADFEFVNKTDWSDSVECKSSHNKDYLNTEVPSEENGNICDIMNSPELKKKKYEG